MKEDDDGWETNSGQTMTGMNVSSDSPVDDDSVGMNYDLKYCLGWRLNISSRGNISNVFIFKRKVNLNELLSSNTASFQRVMASKIPKDEDEEEKLCTGAANVRGKVCFVGEKWEF